MPEQTLSTPQQTKAQRTRAAILAAAERHFAQHGYSETQLQDVADAVGLRRPALLHHFRDKRALYDAVMEDVFSDLLSRVEVILGRSGPLAERIDASVGVWIDALAARPAMARPILRKVAEEDSPGDPSR